MIQRVLSLVGYWSVCWTCFIGIGMSCCAQNEPPGVVPTVDREWIPEVTSLADPVWSPKVGAGDVGADPVIATVGEAKIFRSALQRQVDLDAGQTPIQEIVNRMIESEVLAQEAFRRGFQNNEAVVEAIRQAAIQRFLTARFVQEHGHEKIREEDYQRAYNFPGIRIKFDHFDLYFVIDVQIACCHGSVQDCKLSTKAQECFNEKTPMIQSVYDALVRKGPYKDEVDFQTAAEEIRALYPDIGIKKLDFWYKQGIPYEQQKGFTKLNADLVEAVVAAPMFEVLPPVRSNHAWHIEYKYRHVAEERRKLDDPGVREEIAANIYPQIQTRDYAEYVGQLFKQYQVQRDYDKLRLMDVLGEQASAPASANSELVE